MFYGQCLMAQAQSDAMYIYRNDGEFNAFLEVGVHLPVTGDDFLSHVL